MLRSSFKLMLLAMLAMGKTWEGGTSNTTPLCGPHRPKPYRPKPPRRNPRMWE